MHQSMVYNSTISAVCQYGRTDTDSPSVSLGQPRVGPGGAG